MLLNQTDVRIRFSNTTTMIWQHLVGYDRFNTYRGDLAELSSPAPTWGACFNASDPDLTDNMIVDAEAPDAGDGFFYLMSRVRDGAESDLGMTSAGVPRVPATPCK